MRKFYATLIVLLISIPVLPQSDKITVKGKVTDQADGSSLPGMSIVEKGTTNGTTTDSNGQYALAVSPTATLVFTFIGYATQEAEVGNRTTVDIVLVQDITQLSDLVVVGYGTQRKSQITGAISSVENKEFKDQPVTNLASSIQGRVSGLNVTTPSGTPGAGLLINIRGNNSPLYVVDGIPMISQSNSSLSTSFDTGGNSVGSGQNLSSISDINPNDIESIEVLKDASAASIYGARAANGVILITTKRGKTGKPSINFNTYYGVQSISRPIKFMGSEEFVDLVKEGIQNDLDKYNADPNYFGPGFDPSVLTGPLPNFDLTGVNTNWLKEVSHSAPISNFEFSLGGGNEKTKYYTSLSYFKQVGTIIENYYDRINYRLNLDQKVTDKLTVGTSVFLAHSKNKRSFNDNTYTGIITNIVGASPLMPVYDANGNYTNFEDYQANWLSDNPVKSAKEIKALTTTTRILGTAFAEYSFIPELKFRTSISTDLTYTKDDQFKSPITADAQAVGGEAFQANYNNTTWLNENILTYTKQMGSSNLSLLGGFTLQKSVTSRSSVTGQGFPSGGLENISSAANIVKGTGTETSWSLMSFLGRVNYSLKDKYLLTATIRADGSSRFSQDNQFGYFPSASVAWRISQEEFLQSNEVLSDLKFRVSYGLTGDQEIGDFQSTTFYSPSRYSGQAGVKLRNIADPTLTWQENRMANLGLDYELFKGKISGSVEFFRSTKNRLLSQDAIPGTTGFPTITRNSGEIQNTGFEFGLNARLIDKGDFQWNLGFNFTTVKNEIKNLTNDGILVSGYNDLAPTHILKIGQPVSSFWGVKYLGVDPATGDPMYQDSDNDGDVDGDDAQIIGKAFPDAYGGLTNTFKYKKIDLSIFARYSIGNDVYNLIRPVYESLGYGNDGGLNSVYSNNATTVRGRWTKPGDQTNIPRASQINANFYEGSSQFVENGSFLRIQNINLGYTMGASKVFSSVRVYFEVQNLYVFSKYKGFDPEVSSTGGGNEYTAGIDYGAYPQARTFLVGFNFNF